MSLLTSLYSVRADLRRMAAWAGTALLSLLLVLAVAACDRPDPLALDADRLHSGEIELMRNGSVTITPGEATIVALDWTVQLTATVRNGGGREQPNANVSWRSLDTGVAVVNRSGRVTAIGEGMARITASAAGAVDTAHIEVRQVVAAVTVLPESALLYVGDIFPLSALALDGAGNEVTREIVWTTTNSEVARVDADGIVAALAAGTVIIRARVMPDDLSGTTTIQVQTPPAPPPPPGPGAPGEWDVVLADTLITEDVVVPGNERWLIGQNVSVQGNLRTVNGTIALRPGSSLTFVGADPSRYVGGGMHFGPQFADDIGLWVGGHGATGRLDVQCTPKRGWNRTGADPSWRADDEYFIAPTTAGDYTVRRWTPGQPIPRADPRVPAAEVANVTRDCSITGPGHIHIHSSAPQRIEYVRLNHMGVTIPGVEDSGRYAIHLHMMGEGARGTVIRGVAAAASRSRVFVPHASHGVLMEDNVSVGSWFESLWWDHNGAADRTDDLSVDQLLVLGTFAPRDLTTEIKPAAVLLGGGDNLSMRRSAVAGMTYYKYGRAYTWHPRADDFGPDVWTFEENVAHNNRGDGLRLYNTRPLPHVVERFTAYRNGNSGIESGGYASANHYRDVTLIGNKLSHHSNSRVRTTDGLPGRFENFTVDGVTGAAMLVTKLSIRADENVRWEFVNCSLRAAPGNPKVRIDSSSVRFPWRAAFIRCGMTPDDIEWTDLSTGSNIDGSSVLIEHEDGTRWEIVIENGLRQVRLLQ